MKRFEIICTSESEDLSFGASDDPVSEVIEAVSEEEAVAIGMKRLVERLDDREDVWSVVHCKATDTIIAYDQHNNVIERYYDFKAEKMNDTVKEAASY